MCHELLLLKDAAQKAGNWRTHVILVHSVSSSDIPNCWVWFFLQNSRDAHFCKRFSSPTFTGNGHHHFPLVECPMDGLWTSSAWLDERNLCQKGSYGWWGWWDKHRKNLKWEISRLFGRVPACSSDISKIVWLANLMAVHVYNSELRTFLWNYITDHGVLSLSIPYQKGHQFLRPCHGLGIPCPTDRQPQGYRIGFYKEPMVDDDFWPTFATWLRWMKSSRYAALPMIKMEHVCRVIPSTVFCFHQTLNIRIVCPVQSCILQELPLKEFE